MMWAPKCALPLFLGTQIALGQVLVPEPLVQRVGPHEGSRGIALQEPSKAMVPGTSDLGHRGGLTLPNDGRGVGEVGLIPIYQHRRLVFKTIKAKIQKIADACIIIVEQVRVIFKELTTLRRLLESAKLIQVDILITFTYADGTTGTGIATVELDAHGSVTFDFELSADEANEAGTGICDGCYFVLEAQSCVANCDDYGTYDTSGDLDYTLSGAPTPPICSCGEDMCDDPHMQGLSGQHIDWSGVDGNWYNLVADDDDDLHVNLRLTAPLPVEFPNRQLITGLSILSEGHSLVIEVKDPYSVATDGCAQGVLPCLANGGLLISIDGHEATGLLGPTRSESMADGVITVSASNLPVECRQFGGDKIWARMHDEMAQGQRQLQVETFEDWVLYFDATMAAPQWCHKYIAEHGLRHVQSSHALFKIDTPTVAFRLHVGVNHQGDGELNWDGRVLPDLDFWQMDVGLNGLNTMNPSLSGVLGETARPVVDGEGRTVMDGPGAMRGTVEDYRVSDALGTDFNLLHM